MLCTGIWQREGVAHLKSAPPRCLLIGWFGSNFGDNLMLWVLSQVLMQAFEGPVSVDVISTDPRIPGDEIRFLASRWVPFRTRTIASALRLVHSARLVVCAGGENIHLTKQVTLLLNTAFALRKPIIVASAGQSYPVRRYPLWLRAALTNVRDSQTGRYLKAAGIGYVELGDLVAAYLRERQGQNRPTERRVAINLRRPGCDPGANSRYSADAYENVLVSLAVQCRTPVDLVVGDPDDLWAMRRLWWALEARGVDVRIVPLITPEDYVRLPVYQAAVVTRLHVALAMYALGTKVLSIAYHEKVRRVLEETVPRSIIISSPDDLLSHSLDPPLSTFEFRVSPISAWVTLVRRLLQGGKRRVEGCTGGN